MLPLSAKSSEASWVHEDSKPTLLSSRAFHKFLQPHSKHSPGVIFILPQSTDL